MATDSSYVDAVEKPQDKVVYIEEFTGVRCPNCPTGASTIETIIEAHPKQVVSLSFHVGQKMTAPIEQNKQDFRPDQGDIMVQSIWGAEVEVKPNATFDRDFLNGSTSIMQNTYTSWPGVFAADLAKNPTTPVNLYLTSSYNKTTGRYDIVATVKYTQDISYSHALNIYISEDGIVDAQELSPVEIIDDYVFNHVFRKTLTDPTSGEIILPDMATKQKGLVYIYRTSLKIDPTVKSQSLWNPDNMKVTAFVNVNNKPADGHVLQVVQTNLKGE